MDFGEAAAGFGEGAENVFIFLCCLRASLFVLKFGGNGLRQRGIDFFLGVYPGLKSWATFWRPSGARSGVTLYPRLAPWAEILRRFAATGCCEVDQS